MVREAGVEDRTAVENLVLQRAAWMDRNGVRGAEGWARNASVLAAQCGDAAWESWVLEADGRILARTAGMWRCPPWAFTEAERADASLFLHGSVSVPGVDPRMLGGLRPGHLLAWWSLYHAAACGAAWVRRGTGDDPALVDYYTRVQGWQVVRTVERKRQSATLLQRGTSALPELPMMVQDRASS
jgi:hypothetical protein